MIIPTVIEKTHSGERAFDIYSRLLNERIIFLGDEVNHQTANSVVAQLLHLAHEDAEADIKLYINSPGGSVYDGLAIYDTIQYIAPDVQTIGIGLQASMGAFLLSSGTQGKVTDQEISLRESLFLKQRLNEILAQNTGKAVRQIEKDSDRDFWMSAEEAQAYGLIDTVLHSQPASGKN